MKPHEKIFHYNIHDLVKIRTNLSKGNRLPSVFLVNNVDSADIELYIDNSKVNTSGLIPIGLRIFYDKNIFIHKCKFFLDAHLEVREETGRMVIRFNPLYKIFRKPIDYFLAFLQMKLLDKGFSFIHAACVAKDGICFLFPAFSDTGKTTTALQFLGSGYNLLGDDMVITDGRNVLSYPFSVAQKVIKPFETVPLLRKLKWFKTINPPIEEKATPQKIFLLKKGKKDEIEEATKEDLVKKLNIIMESSCPLFPFPRGVMLSYYFVKNIDIGTYIEKREKIISRLVNNCETWIVVAKESSNFYKLIKEIID